MELRKKKSDGKMEEEENKNELMIGSDREEPIKMSGQDHNVFWIIFQL